MTEYETPKCNNYINGKCKVYNCRVPFDECTSELCKDFKDYISPKHKVGETIEANWAGGHVTRHVITAIKNTEHGFWYSWIDDEGHESGLHEIHLNKTYKQIKQ